MVSWKEEDCFAGFLFLSVICHGMFLMREWLVLGTIFILWKLPCWFRGLGPGIIAKKIKSKIELCINPLAIFLLLIILSLSGLFQPIRRIEGWLEAFHWLVFLTAYLWGKQLAENTEVREKTIDRVLWIALISTILTWLPGSELIWLPSDLPEEGRFASSFGYPNAAAAFLGCQVLLLLKDREIKSEFMMVFVLSVVSTGSRAAVALLFFFAGILILKRIALNLEKKKELVHPENFMGFYKRTVWADYSDIESSKKNNPAVKVFTLSLMIFLLQQTVLRCQGSIQHLLNWTDTSLAERMIYYLDSIKIAWYAHFLPQAGGWLAFPFIQSVPYWTLDPHSSFCRILLNQGLPGVIILGIWALKGIKNYLIDLIQGRDLTVICCKTAVLYLGIHSLIDVDMSFGALGIIFWLLVGITDHLPPAYDGDKAESS